MAIEIRRDRVRGCGWRKQGGLYLGAHQQPAGRADGEGAEGHQSAGWQGEPGEATRGWGAGIRKEGSVANVDEGRIYR